MRIKHWAGYGTVNAKKINDWHMVKPFGDETFRLIQIEVTGEHERGLCIYDDYDIHRWLGRYFAKDKTYKDLVFARVDLRWEGGDGYTTLGAHAVATYILKYKEEQ